MQQTMERTGEKTFEDRFISGVLIALPIVPVLLILAAIVYFGNAKTVVQMTGDVTNASATLTHDSAATHTPYSAYDQPTAAPTTEGWQAALPSSITSVTVRTQGPTTFVTYGSAGKLCTATYSAGSIGTEPNQPITCRN